MQISTLVFASVCLALLAGSDLVAAAAYDSSNVGTVGGLNQKQEAYQLGVWTFIILLVIGILGFGTMANIDYSDDNLLTSAPDTSKNE